MLASSSVWSSVIRHFLALAVVALVSTAMARADGINFDNQGGTAKTLTDGAFELTSPLTGASGTLTFTTSSSFSGSLATGGQWAVGGTFTVREGGQIVFSGQFSGPVTWTLNTATCATGVSCFYTLSGDVAGTYWANGKNAGNPITITDGATTQISLTSIGQYSGGAISPKTGATNLETPAGPAVTGEAGSLALMGTGLLGVGYAARRRMKGERRDE